MNDLSIKWKDFYKNVFALVVPMALQNLINVGVTAADVVMLGKVSEKVLSGASLAGQIQYIMVLFLFGLTSHRGQPFLLHNTGEKVTRQRLKRSWH